MSRSKKRPIELEKWQTDVGSNCPKDCWCRRIVTVPKKGKRKRCFIQQGWITKEQAELIVRIHNEWLENGLAQEAAANWQLDRLHYQDGKEG